jgi:hypothetical protein
VAQRLFLFLQMEFPGELAAPDGRYVLRQADNQPAQHVVVLSTIDAQRKDRRRRFQPRRQIPPDPPPAVMPLTRATVIDAVAVTSERQARAWINELHAQQATSQAMRALNRVLYAHRLSSFDPYAQELKQASALATRAGWGEGEQVAAGLWSYACALSPSSEARRRGSGDDLAAQERMAALLSARERALDCEELCLRAALDLDQGRIAHAALELAHAYSLALDELADQPADLAERLAELQSLQLGVKDAAASVLSGGEPEALVVAHALARLQAALRARQLARRTARSQLRG